MIYLFWFLFGVVCGAGAIITLLTWHMTHE